MLAEALSPIVDQIFSIIYEQSESDENVYSRSFFKEVVTRCVADAAGILQTMDTSNAQRPLGAELGSIYNNLKSAYSKDSARAMILGNLSGFTKGLVHTPHPTEVFTDEAIHAESKVVEALLANPQLFKRRADKRYYTPNPEQNIRLHNALQDLDKALQKPMKNRLHIDQEMYRSIMFSRLQFDSVPLAANAILEATEQNSSDLSMNELHKFGHIVDPGTWSPGDEDSKPDMTVSMLQKGVDLNHRAMMFHYYRTLTALGSDGGKTLSDDTRDAINKIMMRLLKTGFKSEPSKQSKPVFNEDYAKDRLFGKSKRPDDREVLHFGEQYSHYAKLPFFSGFLKKFPALAGDQELKEYTNPEEFLNDLAQLRDRKDLQQIVDSRRPRVSSIDALIIQAMNFKDTALRVQIRQNAKMHRDVLDYLMNLIPEDKFPQGLAAKIKSHNPKDSSSIEMLLDTFLSKDKSHPEFTAFVQQAVAERLAEIGKLVPVYEEQKRALEAQQNDPARKDETPVHVITIPQNDFNFYQTMESFGLAAKYPERISRYLIAECRSKTDMLEAFFMLKVMESLRAPDAQKKVEIVNLVEHPDMAMPDQDRQLPAATMTAQAMNNPYFAKQHLGIHSSNYLLDDFSIAHPDKHCITVAEVKRMHQLKINPGDETKEIKGVKMMMGAGSDITKAGSAAAAAAMMDAMEKTREALLNNEVPVLLIDYTGCGGGVHRSQPVSSSFETVQGRSMRQSAESISHKTMNLLTRNLRNRLATNPASPIEHPYKGPLAKFSNENDRALMCRLNLGNMADMASNPGMWEHETKARTYAMMNTYQDLYKSAEFKELNAFTARVFVDLTQFAARPPKRIEPVTASSEKTGFPPPVDVEKTRAIGFGAALNASGICAPLFYGASRYLEGIETNPDDLRKMYLYDPKAQDTINRMTYGIVMADMDVAWKYLGYDVAPQLHELRELEMSTPAADDREGKAKKCLAKIHLEYNAVANKLLKLHQSVTGRPMTNVEDGKKAANAILETLPIALREQLKLSKKNIQEPRNKLAQLFDSIRKGETAFNSETIKLTENGLYDKVIYPAMGAIYEWSEHTPRAYTRPAWAKSVELQSQTMMFSA